MSIEPAFLAQPVGGRTPSSVSLQGGYDLDLRLVSAVFDASGAAATFKACCSFYAQSGELMGRFFPETNVSPGDVAEVSFAPLGSGAGAPTPAGGGVVEAWSFTVNGFAITGGGFDRIVFTGASNRNASGLTYDLDGSGDLEILAAGCYLLHLRGDTFPVSAAGQSTNAQLSWNVSAGTVWGWSSKGVGMALEGNARWALVIDDFNNNRIDAQGAIDLLGVLWLRTTDTFPVTIESYTTYQVNGADTAGTANFKLSCIRLGDLFVF